MYAQIKSALQQITAINVSVQFHTRREETSSVFLWFALSTWPVT